MKQLNPELFAKIQVLLHVYLIVTGQILLILFIEPRDLRCNV
jgi:hypothetical protein